MTITIKYAPYNSARFNPPWAARVRLADCGTRLDYEFLRACLPDKQTLLIDGLRPGDLFAHGIKDTRRGNRTENHVCVAGADGAWEEIDKTDAVMRLREERPGAEAAS